ncbi:MAG TPA: sigma factor-like helix-turn-helix DNA-binding protein [Polyangia bacterium]|nr:sigma factor-like helix-turn-helix DNA-binding protein [Polyangia bacterium]
MNVSLVRLTPRQWERIPDGGQVLEEPWRAVPPEDLAAALCALERPLAEVLVLYFQRGLQPSEIAARTGLPLGTVAARILRGCRRLRRLLRGR